MTDECIDRHGRRRKMKAGEVLADGETLIIRMRLGDGKTVEAISTPDGMKPLTLTNLDKHRPHGSTNTAAAERSYGGFLARKHDLRNLWRQQPTSLPREDSGGDSFLPDDLQDRAAYIKRTADAWRAPK